MSRLLESSPRQVTERMRAEGVRRAYLVYEPQARSFNVSHPMFADLGDWLLSGSSSFRGHEAIFLAVGAESEALFSAFVHRTVRGQAQGGLRHWRYERFGDLVRDGLRLSVGMTRKNALAGLWWGGGKGILARGESDPEPEDRRRLFREYGAFVSSLRGCYVTAEDAGTHPTDMAEVFRTTRFATCIPEELGGSGNPSHWTAAGVVCAAEAALDFLELGSLRGKTVTMQGTGNVGSAMIPMLLERDVARIVASELSDERRNALLDTLAEPRLELRAARSDEIDIVAEPCDVLVPCALGGTLGPKTIPQLAARVVCGPANNQLVDPVRDAEALVARGITHVPEIVANRMGIVHCANEQYGYVNGDPLVRRHLGRDWPGSIDRTTRRVLRMARIAGSTPVAAAHQLAEELAEQPHPIFGHRARKIVDSLVADRWERE